MNQDLFKNKTFHLLAGLMVLALSLTGCGTAHPSPRPWNLSITKTTPASIQVDLIGVTEAEKSYWEAYNIDDYWREGNLRRQDAHPLTKVLQLGQPWIISMNDPKWQEWLNRGDSELLIIANLPGHFDSGPADTRRRFIPLDKHAWKAKKHTLEIEIQETMILPLTPMSPQ